MRGGYKVSVLHGFLADHRNDSITNTLSFIGVMLATRIDGFALFDPCTSLIFLIFITYNWASNAIDEMKALLGIEAEADDIQSILIRVLT